MSKRESAPVYDKEAVRDKRNKSAEHKGKKSKKNGNEQKFDRSRARQKDSERAREENYFY